MMLGKKSTSHFIPWIILTILEFYLSNDDIAEKDRFEKPFDEDKRSKYPLSIKQRLLYTQEVIVRKRWQKKTNKDYELL